MTTINHDTAEQILANALAQYWDADAIIKEQGLIVGTQSGSVKPNPAVAIQKAAFEQFVKLFAVLRPDTALPKLDELQQWRNGAL